MLFFIAPVYAHDFVVKKLKTGQTVIVKQVSDNPIVTIDTWIKTGSIDENADTSGLAHFLEHLFFKGTQKYPTGEFDKILENKGGVTNAATSKDFTHYYLTLPSRDFELAMSLHSDMLLNPLIPRKELEKERLVVLEEISKSNDSVYSLMSNQLFDMLYKDFNHPYMRPVLGSSKNIENVSRENILNFYRTNYTKDNFTTVIVGDVEPSIAFKKAEEYFENSDKSNTSVRKKYPKISKIKGQNVKIATKNNIETGYLTLAYRTVKAKNVKDVFALDILAVILGNGESSRLNQVLKEQKQIVSSIQSGSSNSIDDGLFSVSATFEPKNLETVKKSIFSEIEYLKNNGINENELLKAKNLLRSEIYFERESISNMASEMGYYTTIFGSADFYNDYLKNIDKITVADVLRVAKKYLDNNNYVLSIVMPQNFKVEAKTVKKEHFDAKILESNDKITKYQLQNGATLIIEKNSANSIVAVNIKALGGNFIEKIPSTSILAANTATSGTKNYSNKEFAQKLDENGIKLSMGSAPDTFTINVLSTKNSLDIALDLLDEVVNSPSFQQNEIDKAKNLQLASIKAMRDNPLSLNLDIFRGIAFQNSKYGVNSTIIEQNIGKVTRGDILNYYNNILNAKNLTISICGDVDDKKMIDYFSRVFVGKNNKFDLKSQNINAFKPKNNIENVTKKQDVQTAWLLLGFKTCPVFNQKDLATLKIINAILGEGMSSRLFTNLRDNQGLAYAIGSSISQNYLDGVFFGYIGTNPKNIELAKNGILKEFYKFKTQYVTQKELQEAKDKILGNLLISLETNMEHASLNGLYGTLGYNINHLEEYKKLISEVSASDILSVANKYFKEPYIFSIVQP